MSKFPIHFLLLKVRDDVAKDRLIDDEDSDVEDEFTEPIGMKRAVQKGPSLPTFELQDWYVNQYHELDIGIKLAFNCITGWFSRVYPISNRVWNYETFTCSRRRHWIYQTGKVNLIGSGDGKQSTLILRSASKWSLSTTRGDEDEIAELAENAKDFSMCSNGDDIHPGKSGAKEQM